MWHLLRRFAGLSARDRALALRAAMWLLGAHLALRVIPFRVLLRQLHKIQPRRRASSPANAVECERAVLRAARVVPHSSCLVQATAGAALLRRERRPVTLTLHVALSEHDNFKAHAVVRSGDVIVTGRAAAMEWPVILRTDLAG